MRTDDVMGGEPRIDGHRITVRQVAEWVKDQGLSAQAVADRYDLDVADVYRALAYCHEHQGEMAEVRRRKRLEQRALENGATTLAEVREGRGGEAV